ncbi:MAG TPA: tannase/feruloyl esterase family alpha/beta hydrolase [Bryobacteraceae bacterium]|jgi:feruloyl esterase|nr:tannase/feruloyl esterase family alpha/beta hydrolase [Bryobacteraceae bacterium]
MAPCEAWIAFVVAMLLSAVPAAAASCDRLASLSLPHASITLAQSVAAGQFAAPGSGGPVGAAAFRALPAFCRIAATLQPVPDSAIRIEVWMPASGWNGKLQSVGNGAWAGTISYSAMAAAVAAGYAAASTDTGHTGNSATFVVGHPEKLVDFAYRSVHEMTIAAKAIAASLYGNGPVRSYFNGCSTGGRQALTEAQRFPNDYDGIVAGAAANYPTHLQGAQVWTAKVSHQDEAGYIPPGKYALLHKAALEACDALDGVKDGVLEDPTRCHFEPAAVLTAEQSQVARKIYAGPMNPRTGASVFPGLEPGSEMGWDTLSGKDPLLLANETYQYLVFQDASWDYRKFDADHDVAQAEKVIGATMDAIDPNLRPFFGHGGKLLMYHGWADPGIAPLNSVHYYSSVVDTLGGAAKDSIRLFMVPGMGHCRGGDGTDTFDSVAALDQWVVQGRAPDQIPASHSTKGAIDKTRPLCPYPQVATYKGSGDTNDAANFACSMR